MSKNISRWLWCLSAGVALCLIGVMLYPSVVFSETLYITCIYVVVDAFALAIGYSMLRKLNLLMSWKGAVYLAAVVIGSLAINFFLSVMAYKSLLLFAIVVFLLLGFLNFALSKKLFAVSFREGWLIGMLVGLVHALLCIMATPVHN